MQGTCEEEVQRIEAFLDTVMRRTQGLAQRAAANEALWKGQGIPWDTSIFASVRANSLPLATLYMSRQGSLTLSQRQLSPLTASLPTRTFFRLLPIQLAICSTQAADACWRLLTQSQPDTLASLTPVCLGWHRVS